MTARHALKWGGALAAAALLSSGDPSPAAARDASPSFALAALGPAGSKGYFVWDGAAGTVGGRVRVTNVGERAGVVDLYTVDAVTSTRSGVTFRARGDRREDVGAWSTVSESSLRLAPGASRIVRVQAIVPPGARPGHHVGGLVADNPVLSDAEPAGARSGRRKARFAVKVHTLRAIALQVDVPGPSRESLGVRNVSAASAPGLQEIRIGLDNDGDLMLKPKGSIVVTDEDGRVVRRRELTLDTLLPRSAIDYPAVVDTRPLRPGTYEATVVLRYGREGVARYTGAFDVTEGQEAVTVRSEAPPALPRQLSSLPPAVIALVAGLALALAAMAAYLVRVRTKLRRSLTGHMSP